MTKRIKWTKRPVDVCETEPFESAEQAWFWFARCLKLRQLGARLSDRLGGTKRPCDPDDVYVAVRTLERARKLSAHHIRVLGEYALLDRPPDPRNSSEVLHARFWDEALDRLTTLLRRKGIISDTPENPMTGGYHHATC